MALIVVTLLMAAFTWYEPVVAVFAAIPMLIWCWGLAQSDRAGLVIGLILLVLTAWILMPRVLGLSGQWVPSVFEVCLFLPILSAIICADNRRPQRARSRMPAVWFSAFAVAGILTALYTVVFYMEGDTGNEGVWPGPSGLQVVEGELQCGSGGCTRQFVATGDRAPERTRAYLDSHGFTAQQPDGGWECRVTGLLLTYKACAVLKEVSPTSARVSWSII
ncbi:hypothetical protein JOF56_005374 [Kibdelosporangium banguiense]|uniref:Uncharacterized protein n=1 Tax=Kibdelosporangium banguiense TaxID=1365924 RepID=A0ABS4TKY3_9PSEU|nr:hypothetical protein [Kibdelosporangium banguiense]MBP2324989.1 hypothetical protein [Kibdelosporangium banguiense]